jgi:hypothetical protein
MVVVYYQITSLTIYYIISRLVTLLKVNVATIQFFNIPVLTIYFKEINFSLHILPLLYIM